MARRTVRSRATGFLIPLLSVFIVGYFVWHGLHGVYGFWNAKRLDAQATELETELARLVNQREQLEHHIALLRPESLDPDMLEERARAILNHAHPNEVVIMREPR